MHKHFTQFNSVCKLKKTNKQAINSLIENSKISAIANSSIVIINY